LNYFRLILDDLLVSVDHHDSTGMHLFEESGFVVQQNFILTNLGLHSLFKFCELVITDCSLLQFFSSSNFTLDSVRFSFNCFDLIHNFSNSFEISISMCCFNSILHLVDMLTPDFGPFTVLIIHGTFNRFMSNLRGINFIFKVSNSVDIVGSLMMILNTRMNLNFMSK
jgi:hypothetical protein